MKELDHEEVLWMSILALYDKVWKNKANRTILLSMGLAGFFVLLGFILILWPRPEAGEPVSGVLSQIGLGDLTLIDLLGIICLGLFYMFVTIGIATIRETLRQEPGLLDILVGGIIAFAIAALLLSWWGAIISLILILIFAGYIFFSKPSD